MKSRMTIRELLENWIADIIGSALGLALIYFAFDIKAENPYYWIPLVTGLILQIPTIYFQIWRYLKEFLKSFGVEIE